jgi:hypothetical protein
MRAAGARITVVRTMMITAVVEGNLDGLCSHASKLHAGCSNVRQQRNDGIARCCHEDRRGVFVVLEAERQCTTRWLHDEQSRPTALSVQLPHFVELMRHPRGRIVAGRYDRIASDHHRRLHPFNATLSTTAVPAIAATFAACAAIPTTSAARVAKSATATATSAARADNSATIATAAATCCTSSATVTSSAVATVTSSRSDCASLQRWMLSAHWATWPRSLLRHRGALADNVIVWGSG